MSETCSTVKPVDTADYGVFYGILNPYGQFWTPLIFDSEEAAREHIKAFWRLSADNGEEFLRRCGIIQVRAIVSPAPSKDAEI